MYGDQSADLVYRQPFQRRIVGERTRQKLYRLIGGSEEVFAERQAIGIGVSLTALRRKPEHSQDVVEFRSRFGRRNRVPIRGLSHPNVQHSVAGIEEFRFHASNFRAYPAAERGRESVRGELFDVEREPAVHRQGQQQAAPVVRRQFAADLDPARQIHI